MGAVTSSSANFKDKYTTADLVLSDAKEKDKVTLSNDAYAIGQLLECLINKLTTR
jgi:hypothetical protein